jgi:hypothetical protein
MHLPPHEREAGAEFEQKFLDVLQQAQLNGPLVGVVAEIEKVEEVRVFGDLLRKVDCGGGSVCAKLVTALPWRSWRAESIWSASTSRDQPFCTAMAAYQRRWLVFFSF